MYFLRWATYGHHFDRVSNLLAVAKSSTIKANGIDLILKPFLDDLKTLYKVGITLQFNKKDELWKGALLAFLPTTLLHTSLAALKNPFLLLTDFAVRDKEYSQNHFRESQFILRSPESHAEQCCRLNGPNRLQVSVEYGINRHSSLDSLPYFSVIECMPHDIMHNLFEGVIPYEMKLLIHHCTSKSYITVNHRLSAFDFGYSEIGDRPALIQDGSKLRQTESQMWLLAIVFPLLVGDLIPRDDCHWKCFLKLLKICQT